MLRIITGIAKNKKIKIPNVPNYRGVQEKAKGALFSILADEIVDKECLDLFAGSGTLGLEALSRGAKSCDFVDSHYDAIQTIQENITKLGFSEKSEIIHKDAVKHAGNTDKKYDIIFLDPFYNDTSHVFLMKCLEEILNEKGKIIFFHGENTKMETLLKNTTLKVADTRRFGNSYFDIINHKT